MKRAEIVALAREVLGCPYGHQGRVAGVALDCAGVPVHVGRRMGMDIADVLGYGRLPKPDEMRAALDRSLVRVLPMSAMQAGDVVWLRFQREPQHLGILGDYHLGGLSLIHAYNGGGVNKVVEHRLDDAWRSRVVAAWSFVGVEE